MRHTASLAGAILAVVLIMAGGCTSPSADPIAGPSPSLTPSSPTPYMENATQQYNAALEGGFAPGWNPVVREGLRWSGKPETYEKVCGASFLDRKGRAPVVDGPAPEGSPSSTPGGTSGQTWFEWAQAQPAVWAAFNAWLADPAVVAAIGPGVAISNGGTLPPGQIGDYSACAGRQKAAQSMR